MDKQLWVLCPICNNKTRTKVREDTALNTSCSRTAEWPAFPARYFRWSSALPNSNQQRRCRSSGRAGKGLSSRLSAIWRRILIKVSVLHFGQNKGNFISSVSSRTLVRVLLLQIGHNTHNVAYLLIFITSFIYLTYQYYMFSLEND